MDIGITAGGEVPTIAGRAGVVDIGGWVSVSVTGEPDDATAADAAATAANSSSAFLIKSKSLNELRVLLLSLSFEIDSR